MTETQLITVERIGRRSYFRGNTFAAKDRLRAAGAKWDADKRAWWMGSHAEATALVQSLGAAAPGTAGEQREVSDSTPVAGKARYKGHEYLLLWEGTTKKGHAAKLAFTDGSKVFWADRSEYDVTKVYEQRECRGQVTGMTFGKLSRLREEHANQRKQERSLGARDGVVGERGEVTTQFLGSRIDRKPRAELGELRWIKRGGEYAACVVVGYELASYVSSDQWEDFGHGPKESGWYGNLYHRLATAEEAASFEAHTPRPNAGAPRSEVV